MSTRPTEAGGSCSGGCEQCAIRDTEPPAPTDIAGWKLVASSAGVFLFPLLAAFAGAAWAGPGRAAQAAGGVGGLLAGMGIAHLAYRVLRARHGAARP